MYSPEHLVFGKVGLWVWMYWRDVPRERIPLSVWLNPLRYQVSYVWRGKRIFQINQNGWRGQSLSYWLRKRFGAKP